MSQLDAGHSSKVTARAGSSELDLETEPVLSPEHGPVLSPELSPELKQSHGAIDASTSLSIPKVDPEGAAYRWMNAEQDARSIGEATTYALTEKRFPCGQCGAVLRYAIGTRSLKCQYCGHENPIATGDAILEELDLHVVLRRLDTADRLTDEVHAMSCPNCAATFSLDAHIHAGECPFCGTTVVTSTSRSRPIKPKGLLPFGVTADEAKASYQSWLKGLWFAPNELKKYARDDTPLNGVYIPYWTYDSDTATAYRGQRGDVYYVSQRYTTTVNGRRVTRTRQVPKIRWRPASGRTSRHFDDMLIGATRTLPRKITDWLAPWDLQNLVSYTEDYLAGFASEVYQVSLDEGFELAQKNMDTIIRTDVNHAIGGDQQRISSISTRHSDTTFKHVLLPLWTAGFTFRNKTYRFVVNGRSGKVRGERPWSVWKIGLLCATMALLAVAFLTFGTAAQSGVGGEVRDGWGGVGEAFNDGIRNRVNIDWGSDPATTSWPVAPATR